MQTFEYEKSTSDPPTSKVNPLQAICSAPLAAPPSLRPPSCHRTAECTVHCAHHALHCAHIVHCADCKLRTTHCKVHCAHTVHVQCIFLLQSAYFKIESLVDISCCTFSRDISPGKILNPSFATNHQPMNQIVNDRPTHRPTDSSGKTTGSSGKTTPLFPERKSARQHLIYS